MAAFADTILTELRTRGARQYTADVTRAGDAVDRLAINQERVRSGAEKVGKSMDRMGRSVTSWATRLGSAMVAAAAGVTVLGLNYNATKESATAMLGSMIDSKVEVGRLVDEINKLAASPALASLGAKDLFPLAAQLRASGVEVKDIIPDMRALGSAATVAGGLTGDTADRLERLGIAFSQIWGRGKLQAEELGQILEAVPQLSRKEIAEALGLGAGFDKAMQAGKVMAEDALPKILKLMDKKFAKTAVSMGDTFSGQLATIKENANITFGAITQPLFDALNKKAFPELNKFTTGVAKVFQDNNTTLDQKLSQVGVLFERHLKPLAGDFVAWWNREKVGEQISRFVDQALPKVLSAMQHLAVEAGKSFLKAWLNAGLATKLFVGWLVLARFGVFSAIASKAADFFIDRYTERLKAKKNTAKVDRAGRGLGRTLGKGMAIGISVAVIAALPELVRRMNDYVRGKFGLSESGGWGGILDRWKNIGDWLKKNSPLLNPPGGFPKQRAAGGPVLAGHPYIVGERRRELFIPDQNGTIMPRLPKGASPWSTKRNEIDSSGMEERLRAILKIDNYVLLDGRVVAKNTAKHTDDKIARR